MHYQYRTASLCRFGRLLGLLILVLSGCRSPQPPAPASTETAAPSTAETAALESEARPAEPSEAALPPGAVVVSLDDIDEALKKWRQFARDEQAVMGNMEAALLGWQLAQEGPDVQRRMLAVLDEPDAERHAKFFVAKSIQNDLEPSLIPEVAAKTAPDKDQMTRRFSAEILALSGDESARATLEQLRADEDKTVQLAGRLGLVRLGDEAERATVSAQYQAPDAEPHARQRILHELLHDPQPSDVPVFNQAVTDTDLEPNLWLQVVQALTTLGNAQSIEALRQYVLASEDPMRKQMAEAAIETIEASAGPASAGPGEADSAAEE